MQSDMIPEEGPALYGLISLLPKAHGVPESELHSVKTDEWDDEDSVWHVKLNGSGQDQYPVVDPIGDDYPSPAMVEMFAGTFLVIVDEQALVLAHPTHLEWYTNPGDETAVKAWETAAIHSVHERLEEVGLDEDLPPAEEFVAPHHRDSFDQERDHDE